MSYSTPKKTVGAPGQQSTGNQPHSQVPVTGGIKVEVTSASDVHLADQNDGGQPAETYGFFCASTNTFYACDSYEEFSYLQVRLNLPRRTSIVRLPSRRLWTTAPQTCGSHSSRYSKTPNFRTLPILTPGWSLSKIDHYFNQ